MVAVVVEKFAAFYNEGARGARGGAASNDKVWGIAKINGTLVTFWGRRNGKLKFKTMPGRTGAAQAEAKYAEKIGGRTDGGSVYMPVNKENMQNMLAPTLKQDLVSFFYSDMALGKLNTNH